MEYTLLRNITIILFCIALLIVQKRNPFEAGLAMDNRLRKILLMRAILGYMITFLTNLCLEMIPFSLLVIIF